MPLFGLYLFVFYNRSKKFIRHLPTNFRTSLKKKGFNISQVMALLLLKPLNLPPNLVLNLIIYITDPQNNIGY